MILFDEVIFGPVLSRRLGISLGINLSSVDSKICSFNCIYCECGWTKSAMLSKASVPSASEFNDLLEQKLMFLKNNNSAIDSITFAGNGEPTLHLDFPEIIDITISLRNKHFPKTKITVLSNASTVSNDIIVSSLKKIDNSMLKLDTGIERTFRIINKPVIDISLADIIANLKKFNGNLIIQSLFFRGEINGEIIDNTTQTEVSQWIDVLRQINPESVVIYPVSRTPAHRSIVKISASELDSIAGKARNAGFRTEVYY
jgi:wyosine [tRNA(Phe)-imidazoG37] synthetase (radical SAM superfamily)